MPLSTKGGPYISHNSKLVNPSGQNTVKLTPNKATDGIEKNKNYSTETINGIDKNKFYSPEANDGIEKNKNYSPKAVNGIEKNKIYSPEAKMVLK